MLAHGFLRHGELIRVAPRRLVIMRPAIDTFVSHIARITHVRGPVFMADTQTSLPASRYTLSLVTQASGAAAWPVTDRALP
jgi:hypothetical protein